MSRLISFAQRCAKYMALRLLPKLLIASLLVIRPLLGPANCKFEIGCTEYAVTQLRTRPFFKAILLILKRIISCGPF